LLLLPENEMRIAGRIALPKPFSLGLTLLCGQCFRWDGPDINSWFEGIAGGAHWRLRQEGDFLDWQCSAAQVRGCPPEEWLSDYLSLDDDMSGWLREYTAHPMLEQSLKTLEGLRLLRQEPWECTISYMFAQGLSVKVIRQALRKFCVQYGDAVEGAPGVHAFPEPEQLVGLSAQSLKPFTNNYHARADRIIRAARVVKTAVISLDHLKSIHCDEARSALMGLDGIGPKIADCILLFSLGHESAFPVDRWVLRAMKRHFRSVKLLGGGDEAPTPSQYPKIVDKARRHLGPRCGLASEYLFLFLRLLEDQKLRQELGPYLSQSLPELRKSPKPSKKKFPVK
jgi:N-glycosylase/DNA lyase